MAHIKRVHLFDDSGVRRPDRNPEQPRRDEMDQIHEEDIGALITAHHAFPAKWNVTAPLHSTRIRGRRGDFAWLGKDASQEEAFLADLEAMLLA
jgi:hypothetical protein